MIHKLTSSEYIFEKEYTDYVKREAKTKIVLHVDHTTGIYKVTPGNSTRGEFGFIGDSRNNHHLWIATLDLIREAVIFAEELVNPVEDIEDIIDQLPDTTEIAVETIEYKEHE